MRIVRLCQWNITLNWNASSFFSLIERVQQIFTYTTNTITTTKTTPFNILTPLQKKWIILLLLLGVGGWKFTRRREIMLQSWSFLHPTGFHTPLSLFAFRHLFRWYRIPALCWSSVTGYFGPFRIGDCYGYLVKAQHLWTTFVCVLRMLLR